MIFHGVLKELVRVLGKTELYNFIYSKYFII